MIGSHRGVGRFAAGVLTVVRVLGLYRAARRGAMSPFAEEAFGTIGRELAFDSGSIITAFLDRPAFTDAHFHGLSDPRALMESWGRVSHLDVLSPRVMARPFEVHRLDLDAPEVAGTRFEPLRAHLARFALWRTLCVAIPMAEDRTSTVILVSRHSRDAVFTETEVAGLAALAPHVAEAAAVCRVLALAGHPEIALDAVPVALVDAGGRFQQTTSAFRRLAFGGDPPREPHLETAALLALRKGQRWTLRDGRVCLEAWLDDDGGMLVRVQKTSRLAQLSRRELEVARRFAEGQSHTAVAAALGISPATVRNHIRHVYTKLAVTHRVELIAALEGG